MGDEKQEPDLQVDGQRESLLFQRVPQEIRNQIYTQLFSSTRFTFGSRWTNCTTRINVKPAPHGLALLRTCRRARLEIADSWLQHVLVSFEDPYTMLDKLSALPIGTLSKIRHMRVSGEGFLYTVREEEEVYSLADALRVFPGLCLDQLTVIGIADDVASYNTLSHLVSRGVGWKTLRFLSPTSAMLGFPAGWCIPSSLDDFLRDWESWRVSQPENWQGALEARDGRDSHPSVIIYRAKEPGHCGLILQPSECVKFSQKPVQELPGSHPNFVPKDPDVTSEGEKDKELLAVVKRGAGADCQKREDTHFDKKDLRRGARGKWFEIGHPSFWTDGKMVPDLQPHIVDDYKDPEEHVWTRRHLCENTEADHYACHLDEVLT
jgi:hypothetical protein